ncbi:kelch repeat protein, partial [Gregarina niphandrodes]
NEDYRALCEVEIYDVFRGAWRTGCPLLQPRRSLSGCVAGGCLFALGGYSGLEPLDSAEFHDPRCPGWFALASMQVARIGAAAVAGAGSELYVLGGSAELFGECYDIRANAWRPLPAPSPELVAGGGGGRLVDNQPGLGLTGAATARIRDQLVLCGGYATNQLPTTRTLLLDLKDLSWRRAAPAPRPLADATLVPNGPSSLLSIGGHNGEGACDMYDLVQDKWTANTTTLNKGERWGHATCVLNF